MASTRRFDVVLLVREGAEVLFPIVSKTCPLPLLPVGNRTLLSYSLQTLEQSGIASVLVVAAGESVASQVSNWLDETNGNQLQVKVATVREECGTADALREVLDLLTSHDVLVVSGDVVTDVTLGSLSATHHLNKANASMLVYRRPVGGGEGGGGGGAVGAGGSGKKEKEKRKDIIGVDGSGTRLVFYSIGGESSHQLHIKRSLLRDVTSMTLYTDLVDAQVYAFNRQALQDALQTKLDISNIQRDLLPYLVRMQHMERENAKREAKSGKEKEKEKEKLEESMASLAKLMSHNRPVKNEGQCLIHVAAPGRFCARVDSLQAYADVNREVSGEAIQLTGYQLSTHNNVVDESVELGSKTAVGPQCMVGEGSSMGDKCSVKKSVVGRHCRIGSNVKIINSVVMDHVTISDGCVVQNSIVCSKVRLQEQSSLKDCQVAAGYTVGAGMEHQRETLAKKEKT